MDRIRRSTILKNNYKFKNDIMKLTKEHLASYLLYNLKVQWHNGDIGYLRGIDQFRNNEYFKDGVSAQVTSDEENDDNDVFPANLVQIKPILRPLSDLTKEIEHNGEKFVPGLKLVSPDDKDFDKMVCEFYNAFPKIPNHEKWIRVMHQELGEVISINPNNIEHLPHSLFKKLIEWHFDIHDLIPNNLAIDINTTK